jgi:hypothetical protein
MNRREAILGVAATATVVVLPGAPAALTPNEQFMRDCLASVRERIASSEELTQLDAISGRYSATRESLLATMREGRKVFDPRRDILGAFDHGTELSWMNPDAAA